jgi:hypothetical protein
VARMSQLKKRAGNSTSIARRACPLWTRRGLLRHRRYPPLGEVVEQRTKPNEADESPHLSGTRRACAWGVEIGLRRPEESDDENGRR